MEDLNTAWILYDGKEFLLFFRCDDVWWFYYFVKSYHLEMCIEVFMDGINIVSGPCFKIKQKRRSGWG